MSELTDIAMGKWRQIIPALTNIPASALNGKHHPCPCTGEGKDRFRFEDKDGRGTYYCACSKGGDGYDLLRCANQTTMGQTAADVRSFLGIKNEGPPPEKKVEHDQKMNRLRKVAAACTEIGVPVKGYFKSRGLTTRPADIKQATLGYYHEGQMYGPVPAMVAAVRDCTGKLLTFHVTYLGDVPGPKRKVLPCPYGSINGGAVRLFDTKPHEASIGLAEGIETAMAATQLYNIPVWACLNRNGLEKFELPEGVEIDRITIFGDNDAGFAGQAGAYRAAERFAARGIEVTVSIPPVTGEDWNDVLLDDIDKNERYGL